MFPCHVHPVLLQRAIRNQAVFEALVTGSAPLILYSCLIACAAECCRLQFAVVVYSMCSLYFILFYSLRWKGSVW